MGIFASAIPIATYKEVIPQGYGKCASGEYTSSKTEQTTIEVGFEPKYICVQGTTNDGALLIYDATWSTTNFKYAGSSSNAQSVALGGSSNYRLYSVGATGFTVNKTTNVYTYHWFAMGD